MPPSCTATAITWVMKPDVAASGPRPVCRTHGSEQAVHALRPERPLEPVAAGEEEVAGERGEPVTPDPPQRLEAEREPCASPQLGAEHAEREVGVREELGEHVAPRLAVAAPVPLELLGVAVGAAEQERCLAVGEGRGGRVLGVQVLEPARGEVVAELRMRRTAHPEGVPRTEDVVVEAGLGDLGRVDRAAEPVVALEHAHAPARAGEKGAARERVDAAADEDGVEVSHRPAA